jgi:hypothetical protein
MMRENQSRVAILATIVAAFGTLASADAAPRAPACAEIRSACEAAGFVRGGAKTGNGLLVHCIAPIMRGSLPPPRASKPLPHIDASLIADCKTQNPKFGQRRAPPSQAAEPQTGAPAPAASPQPDGKQQI